MLPTCIDILITSDKTTMALNSQTRTVVYHVVFNSNQGVPADAQHAVFGDLAIPLLGSVHEETTVVEAGTFVTPFIVNNSEVSRLDDDPRVFQVTIQLVPFVISMEQKPPGQNVKWRIELSIEPIRYTEPATRDRDGFPIVLVTNEPVTPPLLREYYDRDILLSFRTDHLDWDEWRNCAGATNAESITMVVKGQAITFAVDTLKFSAPQLKIVYEADGTAHWWVGYRMQERVDTWVIKFQPKSRYHNTANGLRPNLNDDGREISEPMFLTTDGFDYIHRGDTVPDPVQENVQPSASFAGLFTGLLTIV